MTPDAPTAPSLAVEGRLATLTLRNPAKINVIGPEEVDALASQLTAAVADPSVTTIVLRGEGHRGFCAGGDIKRVRSMITAGELDRLARFWSTEYRLDHLIATCPKPIVSVAHGLTLGGGMGLAAHASHRVVTDSTRMGMPEVLIGLAPDAGGLWLYSRAPGRTGAFAALTAAQLSAGDALYMGLADRYVRDDQVETLIERLRRLPADEALDGFDDRPASWVADHRPSIDGLFGARSVSEMYASAASAATENTGGRAVADVALHAWKSASPTALCVTQEALRRATAMSELTECLAQDLRVGQHCARHPDLDEGIRARVVDKDRAPSWCPPRLPEVAPEEIDRFFEPIGEPLQFGGW